MAWFLWWWWRRMSSMEQFSMVIAGIYEPFSSGFRSWMEFSWGGERKVAAGHLRKRNSGSIFFFTLQAHEDGCRAILQARLRAHELPASQHRSSPSKKNLGATQEEPDVTMLSGHLLRKRRYYYMILTTMISLRVE
jgi:hypothetical protein